MVQYKLQCDYVYVVLGSICAVSMCIPLVIRMYGMEQFMLAPGASKSHTSTSDMEQRKIQTMNLLWAKVMTVFLVLSLWFMFVVYAFVKATSSDPYSSSTINFWFVPALEIAGVSLLAVSHRRRKSTEENIWFRWLARFADFARRKFRGHDAALFSSNNAVAVLKVSPTDDDRSKQHVIADNNSKKRDSMNEVTVTS
jgi:hypothetical protein